MVTATELKKATEKKLTGQAGIDPATGSSKDTTLPTGTEINPTLVTEKSDEVLAGQTLGTTPSISTETASTSNLDIPVPQSKTASAYSAYVAPNTPTALAASGALSSQAQIGNISGAVSQKSEVAAATGTLDQKATVTYQLEELFKAVQSGTELPAWASPAVKKVSAIMAQRGLGASSMASAAMTQAIMESAIPIAQADSQKYAAIQLQNLKHEQQAVLQNAMTYAAMDKMEMDAKTQAAVNNARAFLSIDVQNLTNDQKTQELNYNGKLQTLWKDQAAENAALQFNAKSQNEVDQFFSELGVQAENANKNRLAATEQFNSDQKNTGSRFTAAMVDARDKFNANMTLQINQSNAAWRRQINTANTAVQNESNRMNALNLLEMNQTALNQLWQRYRDEASWALQTSENAKQRAHDVAMFAQSSTFDQSMYESKKNDIFMAELGSAVLDGIFGDMFSS
tara:strand:+ start:216 stop:1583 length:1368 start_codon:yes stop_codon:yes gene_type:complete